MIRFGVIAVEDNEFVFPSSLPSDEHVRRIRMARGQLLASAAQLEPPNPRSARAFDSATNTLAAELNRRVLPRGGVAESASTQPVVPGSSRISLTKSDAQRTCDAFASLATPIRLSSSAGAKANDSSRRTPTRRVPDWPGLTEQTRAVRVTATVPSGSSCSSYRGMWNLRCRRSPTARGRWSLAHRNASPPVETSIISP
jgi:hypothetical protein